MGKIDMKQTALDLVKAYEGLMLRLFVLNAILDENRIQVSEESYDEYLKAHPALAAAVHERVKPLYDAIAENEDLEPALKALLNMPTKGRTQ